MQLEIPAQTAVSGKLNPQLLQQHFFHLPTFPVALYNFFSLGLRFGQQFVKEFVGSAVQGTTLQLFLCGDLLCGCPLCWEQDFMRQGHLSQTEAAAGVQAQLYCTSLLAQVMSKSRMWHNPTETTKDSPSSSAKKPYHFLMFPVLEEVIRNNWPV